MGASMLALRRFVCCLLVWPVVTLAGCAYMESPSILTTAPQDPPKQKKHEPQGGFAVLVEAPGQPTVARATAAIGAFAQRRGFVRQGGARYVAGKIVLDVTFRPADSRVIASLHSFALSRRFVESFYRDFNREYARGYGDENPIIENEFVADSFL